MIRELILLGTVIGVAGIPNIANAQCGPLELACGRAAITILKNPKAAIGAGTSALNGARTIYDNRGKIVQGAGAVGGTIARGAGSLGSASARGTAAIGGPVSPNSTPAYCRNGICYNSQDRRIN